jgi:hypothetical protein
VIPLDPVSARWLFQTLQGLEAELETKPFHAVLVNGEWIWAMLFRGCVLTVRDRSTGASDADDIEILIEVFAGVDALTLTWEQRHHRRRNHIPLREMRGFAKLLSSGPRMQLPLVAECIRSCCTQP